MCYPVCCCLTLLRIERIFCIAGIITESYKQKQENDYTTRIAVYTIYAKQYIHGYKAKNIYLNLGEIMYKTISVIKSISILLILFMQHELYSQNLTNPRTPAEWEKVTGFIMEASISRAHPDIPWEEAIDPYIKAAEVCIDENINFYVLDPDTINGQPNEIGMDTLFANRGLISPYVHIINVPNGEVIHFPWARDHGPFTVYNNFVGDKILMGYDGDSTAHIIANYLNKPFVRIPSYYYGYYVDGGNWVTDGHGTFNIANISNSDFPVGLVDPAIYSFREYLGVQKTLNVIGVSIHADYWIKMINEKTFIVSDIPASNYLPPIDEYFDHNDDILNSISEIETNLSNTFGGNFNFHYIQNAPTFDNTAINTTYQTEVASYTNSVILNGTVIVPQFNIQPYDSNAINIYKEVMPGYIVVGANCRQFAVRAGAMHCISREIYDDDPIYIYHDWYADSLNQLTDYRVDATIKTNNSISGVDLFWSTDTTIGYQSIPMTLLSQDNYQVFIPGQPFGTMIFYYIEVNAANGNSIRKPLIAPNGVYTFYIDPTGATNVIDEQNNSIISEYNLYQNYPNPFNPITHIAYTVPDIRYSNGIDVKITVYDISGKEITTLVSKHHQAGQYKTTWDGTNYSSGVYFYKLTAGLYSEVKKMILIK